MAVTFVMTTKPRYGLKHKCRYVSAELTPNRSLFQIELTQMNSGTASMRGFLDSAGKKKHNCINNIERATICGRTSCSFCLWVTLPSYLESPFAAYKSRWGWCSIFGGNLSTRSGIIISCCSLIFCLIVDHTGSKICFFFGIPRVHYHAVCCHDMDILKWCVSQNQFVFGVWCGVKSSPVGTR